MIRKLPQLMIKNEHDCDKIHKNVRIQILQELFIVLRGCISIYFVYISDPNNLNSNIII